MGYKTFVGDLIEQVKSGLGGGGTLQPQGLAREVVRKMDGERKRMIGGVFVPDSYKIHLHPEDLKALKPVLKTFTRQLRGLLERRVSEKRYLTTIPELSIAFAPLAELKRKEVLIETGFTEVEGAPEPAAAEPTRRRGGRGPTRPEPVTVREETEVDEDDDRLTRVVMEEVAVIEVVSGEEKGRLVPLAGGEHSFGRGQAASVVLKDPNATLSRIHFRIVIDAGRVRLVDDKSRNGVSVNGEKTRDAFLKHGDLIKAGDIKLKYQIRPT